MTKNFSFRKKMYGEKFHTRSYSVLVLCLTVIANSYAAAKLHASIGRSSLAKGVAYYKKFKLTNIVEILSRRMIGPLAS
jgi:hypothetical protein